MKVVEAIFRPQRPHFMNILPLSLLLASGSSSSSPQEERENERAVRRTATHCFELS